MTIPIACAQIACVPFDPAANLARAEEHIRAAAKRGARLVLLPEFLTTGFTYEYRLADFAEPVGGSTTCWLQRCSRQLDCWIGAGMIEQADDRMFDTFVLTGPAGEVFFYRKQHPAFFEALHFHRGREHGILETPIGRIGVMICWDMMFRRLARAMVDRVDLLLICSAWPDTRTGNIPLHPLQGWLGRQPSQRPPCVARRVAVPIAYCNATGPFTTRVPYFGLTYRAHLAGSSSILDREGTILAAAGREETVIVAEVAMEPYRPREKAA
jgi:N-carbamoylputrescine amidase